MTVQLDPPAGPMPRIHLALAQAALQRQNMLLAAMSGGSTGAAASADADGAPAVPPSFAAVTASLPPAGAPMPASLQPGQAPPPAPSSSATPVPAKAAAPEGAVRFTLSAQVGAVLPAAVAQAAAQVTTQGMGPRGVGNVGVGTLVPPGAAGRGAAVAQTLAGLDWPAQGASGPLRSLIQVVVQQLTAQSPAPQRVVASQPWPSSLAQAVEEASQDDAQLSPLQTWRVGQGTVMTSDGPRAFTATLRVLVPWLAAQPTAASASTTAAAMPAAPPTAMPMASQPTLVPNAAGGLQAPFAGPASGLQSGMVALVMQSAHAEGARSSALLSLEFQPQWAGQAAAQVYGRDMQQMRTDPWLQMAQMNEEARRLQEGEKRHAGQDLCRQPACPYAGRAECAQPFCLALREGGIPSVESLNAAVSVPEAAPPPPPSSSQGPAFMSAAAPPGSTERY